MKAYFKACLKSQTTYVTDHLNKQKTGAEVQNIKNRGPSGKPSLLSQNFLINTRQEEQGLLDIST
jgi:hypothetical protein